MHPKYFGDSFDIVKRFWSERLGLIAPLFAHPKFVPTEIKMKYENMTAMRVLEPNEGRAEPFGIFLDPHTGIPLSTASSQRVRASHAPLSFIAAEFCRLNPVYVICFDQSHDRSSGLSRAGQRYCKRMALSEMNIASFYYVSHAPFLFMARDPSVLESIRNNLSDSGIPESRFELTNGEGE